MENGLNAILAGLNDEQKKAVECVEGPSLIVAGAGSGKTRVLTCRIANILASGCPADRIMALTFTKKAADEMKERIALMVGKYKARNLCMGTFHSVFIRFLRDYASCLGYQSSFTIYDASDTQSAVKTCIKELKLDDKIYKPKEVCSRISKAKNNLITDQAYRNDQKILLADQHSKKPRLCDIYSLYVQKCKSSGVMDFDDILVNMNILLRDNKEALAEIAGRFSYIMVDEYQDTNFAQYLIMKKLSGPHRNICVVGDDSQSIYAFRGAKIENILGFKKDYPECKLFRLEQNYRSTQTIVLAANSLIERNSGRIPKKCYSEGSVGEKIKYSRALTETDEAQGIVSSIRDRMLMESSQYQDFAVLYRTNSQSRSIEEALRRRNIPYKIYSGSSFFERAEVKDMMAYFKLVCNPHDDESFKRSVNKPSRGVGDTSLEALSAAAKSAETSLFKAAYLDNLESFGLRNAAVMKIRAFCDMINTLAASQASADAHELALKIADNGGLYAMYKADTSIEGLSRVSNLDELFNAVSEFVEDRQNEIIADMDEGGNCDETSLPSITLADFLENISLLSNVDASTQGDDDADNKVALMTVHSAKGLEFPHVFIAGMEENIFPGGGMTILPNEVEEERRLFYVAITRAKKSVEVSFAETRLRNGRHESNPPSRFLKEIDSQYVDNPITEEDFAFSSNPDPFKRYGGSAFGKGGSFGPGRSSAGGRNFVIGRNGVSDKKINTGAGSIARIINGRVSGSEIGRSTGQDPADKAFVPTPSSQLSVGMRVKHNRFGAGTIEEMSGVGEDVKARIDFDELGIKVIMLKYAKLMKL